MLKIIQVLVKYGTEEHKAKWLAPLLDGTIRSPQPMNSA